MNDFKIEAVGKFTTFTQWVNKASSWIDGKAVCWDSKGRVCSNGSHFMRARDEGTFPVYYGWPEDQNYE